MSGGNGGGVVLMRGAVFTITGTVSSNGEAGQAPSQGGCGGGGCGMANGAGGAGGAVRILSQGTATLGTARITVAGGVGGTSTCARGRSADGAVGRIGVRAASATGTTSPAFDTN